MTNITKLGKSTNGNDVVAVKLGLVQGTVGKSSNDNPTIRLYGQHIIDGKLYYLTGNLTEKKK
jgi:hypothetical protein